MPKERGANSVSDTITKEENGWCDYCHIDKKYTIPTLTFETNHAYAEYSIEICAECFSELLNGLENGKPTKYAEIKAILERG